MKRIFLGLVAIVFLLISSGCIQTSKQIGDFNPYYCEADSDCKLTAYYIDRCCESSCGIFAFNNEAVARNEIWRNNNCNFENETEFLLSKWDGCPESPYYESVECDNIDNIRNATAVCRDNKCYANVEPKGIPELTKTKINEKIVNDTRFCNYRKEDDYSNCTCQEGYVKLDNQVSLHPDCIPEICSIISGYTFVGDLGIGNSLICAGALLKHSYESCEIIEDTNPRDICYFAVVSKTGDLSVCANITDESLKNDCYK